MPQRWKLILGVIILVILAGGGLYIEKMLRNARIYNNSIESGYDLLRHGKFNSAMPFFQQAMKIRPESYDPHYGLGAVYLKQRNYQAAADELELAAKINPDAIEAHYSLGISYHRMKNYPLALREYEVVFKKDPSVQIYNNIGGIYLEMGNYEEALKHFNKSLELNPNYFQANLNIGQVYEKQGNKAKAIAEYEHVINKTVNSPKLSKYAAIAKKRIQEIRK